MGLDSPFPHRRRRRQSHPVIIKVAIRQKDSCEYWCNKHIGPDEHGIHQMFIKRMSEGNQSTLSAESREGEALEKHMYFMKRSEGLLMLVRRRTTL